MRKEEALLITGYPARAKFSSAARATSDGKLESTTSQSSGGCGDWTTIDFGVVYAITQEFAVYGGAGYSKETHYRQYFDNSQTRGDFGFYWVADPAASGTRINVLGGALVRFSRFLVFQLGGESAPQAVNVGVTLMFAP